MPWSRKQMKAARAVMAGATVGGFSRAFAAQVIAEGVKGKKAKTKGKR